MGLLDGIKDAVVKAAHAKPADKPADPAPEPAAPASPLPKRTPKADGPVATEQAQEGADAVGETPPAPPTQKGDPVGKPNPKPTPEPEPDPADFDINGGGHVFADVPDDTTKVSANVTVDSTSDEGLNFFALQVNFNNDTWAHGGLQRGDGERRINWGGLPNRGGGSADYAEPSDEQRLEEIERIQNGEGEERLADIPWEEGVEYTYTVERGDLVTIPAGEHTIIDGEDSVDVDHDREMYEWNFSIVPAAGGDPIFEGTLYNSADSVESISVWNETGYGSTDADEVTHFSDINASSEGGTAAPADISYWDDGAQPGENRPAPQPAPAPTVAPEESFGDRVTDWFGDVAEEAESLWDRGTDFVGGLFGR